MHSYKLNNSYTTYINYTYLNDCIKASKHKKSSSPSVNTKSMHKDVLVPMPINATVYHKTWGEGRLISKEKNGVITVAFNNRVSRFIYPDAFVKGHLARAN